MKSRFTLKRILKYTLYFILPLILLPLTVEVLLRCAGVKAQKADDHVLHLFKSDSILGWRLRTGQWDTDTSDPKRNFHITINAHGKRISAPDDTLAADGRPEIQVYGCSYTFGWSVSDSSVACYKLQNKLPQYRVVNKGVPVYGLAQMYLSLVHSVETGDTPRIAVFNYANFHDQRTPLDPAWSDGLSYWLSLGDSSEYKNAGYPYFLSYGDTLKLAYCPLGGISPCQSLIAQYRLKTPLESSCMGATKTFLYFMAGSLFRSEEYTPDYLHRVSSQTARSMMQYCIARHIIPVFATMSQSEMGRKTGSDIPELLAARGYDTLNYGIDIADRKYNCAPADPRHPSALAHTIFAERLFHFLDSTRLIACSFADYMSLHPALQREAGPTTVLSTRLADCHLAAGGGLHSLRLLACILAGLLLCWYVFLIVRFLFY